MKLTIERSALLTTLGHVQSVVERRNTIPILSNVLIRAGNGAVSFTATDLDISIVESVDADIAMPGATTAPAHTLYDIVRKLPDGAQVELDASGDDGRLVLRAGRSRFQLSCLPEGDFPSLSEDDLPHTFEMPADEMRRIIDKTRFAISTEETRYYLNGIYLHETEQDGFAVMRGVATDGHRLARVQIPRPTGAEGMPGIIFPRKAVGELRKLIDDFDGALAVACSDNRIRFSFGQVVLASKLIDGTFPDYERVIPTANSLTMEVDAKLFAKAVDRVSTISTEKSRAVKLAIAPGNLTLSANSPDQGSAVEELPVSFEGEGMEIGFNSKYLLDIAGQIESENIRFRLEDGNSPSLVEDGEDSGAIYVLMPMRV